MLIRASTKPDVNNFSSGFHLGLTTSQSTQPALVRYLRVVLRLPLNEAVKTDLIPRNVAALATPPKVERREVVPFLSLIHI